MHALLGQPRLRGPHSQPLTLACPPSQRPSTEALRRPSGLTAHFQLPFKRRCADLPGKLNSAARSGVQIIYTTPLDLPEAARYSLKSALSSTVALTLTVFPVDSIL